MTVRRTRRAGRFRVGWKQGVSAGIFAVRGSRATMRRRATPKGWTVAGGRGGDVNDRGWVVELTEPGATLQTPPFKMDAKNGPWLRLNWWATGIDHSRCYVEWTTEKQPEFNPQSRAYFTAAKPGGAMHAAPPIGPTTAADLVASAGETRTMIPVYRIPEWKGVITGLRFHFDNPAQATLVIKSFHTACDTRHNINNSNFIRGCHDYFLWTRDVTLPARANRPDALGHALHYERIRHPRAQMRLHDMARPRRTQRRPPGRRRQESHRSPAKGSAAIIGTCCRSAEKTRWLRSITMTRFWIWRRSKSKSCGIPNGASPRAPKPSTRPICAGTRKR